MDKLWFALPSKGWMSHNSERKYPKALTDTHTRIHKRCESEKFSKSTFNILFPLYRSSHSIHTTTKQRKAKDIHETDLFRCC